MSSKLQKPPTDDIAISVRNLKKTYRLFAHPGDRIKQFFSFGIKHYHREFTALEDVSLDIKKGETIGIVGKNGSGKSTLLQLICGILKPTSGTIQVNGRISALLELGAGFNPEFTGRENVYFQGSIMGFTRAQLDERFDEITAFADIGEFIDQPIRTYSSGMFVRLAFAVSVHVDPEILVVDEALGVGDAGFQEKCITRMNEMRSNGTTILLVSHSLPTIRNFCQRVFWLGRGVIVRQGNSGEICQAYQAHTIRPTEVTHDEVGNTRSLDSRILREKRIAITKITADKKSIQVGEELAFRVFLRFADGNAKTIKAGFNIGFIVKGENGQIVAIFNTVRDNLLISTPVSMVSLHLPNTCFAPGRYFVSVNVCDDQVLFSYDELIGCLAFEVRQEFTRQGIPRWEGELACEHAWHW